jgi:hypothetical protein
VKTSEPDVIAVELAREIVATRAPEELSSFDVASDAYLISPPRAPKSDEETLGFGLQEVVDLVTPVALTVSTEVVRYLWAEAAKTLRERGAIVVRERVTAWLAALRTQRAGSAAAGQLSEKQLAEIRRRVREAAKRNGLPPDAATKIAGDVFQALKER